MASMGLTPRYDVGEVPYADLEAATWQWETLIGKGGFGDVFKGHWNGREVAVKRLKGAVGTSPLGCAAYAKEVEIASCVQARNIVPIIGCCSNGPYRCLVMPLMLATLDERLHRRGSAPPLGCALRVRLSWEAVQGLVVLHEYRVLHGDIKSANILISDDLHASITDMGSSTRVDLAAEVPSPRPTSAPSDSPTSKAAKPDTPAPGSNSLAEAGSGSPRLFTARHEGESGGAGAAASRDRGASDPQAKSRPTSSAARAPGRPFVTTSGSRTGTPSQADGERSGGKSGGGLGPGFAGVGRAQIWGTDGYRAPELQSGRAPSLASDIFSLGVVLLELVTGRSPLGVSSKLSLPEAVRGALAQGDLEPVCDRSAGWGPYGPLAEQVMLIGEQCTRGVVGDRWSAAEVAGQLQELAQLQEVREQADKEVNLGRQVSNVLSMLHARPRPGTPGSSSRPATPSGRRASRAADAPTALSGAEKAALLAPYASRTTKAAAAAPKGAAMTVSSLKAAAAAAAAEGTPRDRGSPAGAKPPLASTPPRPPAREQQRVSAAAAAALAEMEAEERRRAEAEVPPPPDPPAPEKVVIVYAAPDPAPAPAAGADETDSSDMDGWQEEAANECPGTSEDAYQSPRAVAGLEGPGPGQLPARPVPLTLSERLRREAERTMRPGPAPPLALAQPPARRRSQGQGQGLGGEPSDPSPSSSPRQGEGPSWGREGPGRSGRASARGPQAGGKKAGACPGLPMGTIDASVGGFTPILAGGAAGHQAGKVPFPGRAGRSGRAGAMPRGEPPRGKGATAGTDGLYPWERRKQTREAKPKRASPAEQQQQLDWSSSRPPSGEGECEEEPAESGPGGGRGAGVAASYPPPRGELQPAQCSFAELVRDHESSLWEKGPHEVVLSQPERLPMKHQLSSNRKSAGPKSFRHSRTCDPPPLFSVSNVQSINQKRRPA